MTCFFDPITKFTTYVRYNVCMLTEFTEPAKPISIKTIHSEKLQDMTDQQNEIHI